MEVNAPAYEHSRREVRGEDENGNLVLGEREPLDGDEEGSGSDYWNERTTHQPNSHHGIFGARAPDTTMTEIVDEVPETAMPVSHGTGESENYIAFPRYNVAEWYTRRPDGTVKREKFVSDETEGPGDIPVGLDHSTSADVEA